MSITIWFLVVLLAHQVACQCTIADCVQCAQTPSCSYCVSSFQNGCVVDGSGLANGCTAIGGTLIKAPNQAQCPATDPCQPRSGSCSACLQQSGCVVCRTNMGDACTTGNANSAAVCQAAGGQFFTASCPTPAPITPPPTPPPVQPTPAATPPPTPPPVVVQPTPVPNGSNPPTPAPINANPTPNPTPKAATSPPTPAPINPTPTSPPTPAPINSNPTPPPSPKPTPSPTPSGPQPSPAPTPSGPQPSPPPTPAVSPTPPATAPPTPVPGSTLSPEAIDTLCAQALGSCGQCHSAHPECLWCTVPGGGACLRTNSSLGALCPQIGVPFRQGQACPAPNPCTAAHVQNCGACLAGGQSLTCGYCVAFGSGICVGAGSGTLSSLICSQANGTFLQTAAEAASCPTSLSFTIGTQAPTTSTTTTTTTTTTAAATTTTTTTTAAIAATSSGATSAGGATTTMAAVNCTSATIDLICKRVCNDATTFDKCECVDGLSSIQCQPSGCTADTVDPLCLSRCNTKSNIKTCTCADNVPTIVCHDDETIAVTLSSAHSLFVSLVAVGASLAIAWL